MTLRELLEHAHLDALGLLEEDEQASFNASFAGAPPEIQRAIRAEQARWSVMDILLPDVDPSNDLRARVLASIASQIAASEVRVSAAVLADPQQPVSGRVWRGWRASAIGMMAVSAVLGVAFVNVMSLNDSLSRQMQNTEVQRSLMVMLGADQLQDSLFSEQTIRARFTRHNDFTGHAVILYNSDWQTARLSWSDLPTPTQDETYRLVTLDSDGNVGDDIATLGVGGEKGPQMILVASDRLSAGMRLAVVSAARGAASATGVILMTTTIRA
jgi:hypothetical protein